MVEEQEITWINAVPAIITILAMEPSAGPVGQCVRFVRSASAPLARSALRRFEQAFGVPVVETYGMTEAASMITANPLTGPRKPGSAGLPAGAEVPDRPAGRRPAGGAVCAVPGPHRRPGADQGARRYHRVRDGRRSRRHRPGRLAGHRRPSYLDADGYLFLAGRADDVINRGGEIYPREIEDLLLAQLGVRSVAVVGARDEVLGERPVAYVVPAGPTGPVPAG